MTPSLDLLVAGGGPAGLATALYAARAGLSVVVREPRDGVLDKACGEGLMPGGVAALAELGIDPSGMPLAGIRYVGERGSVASEFRSGPGRGVRRTTLHRALREAVLAAGVPIERRRAESVRQRADGVDVDGTRASYLVAADGLHSPVRRHLGLDAIPSGVRRYGLRRHFRVAPWTSYVEVHWAPGREAYVTPVEERLVGVALLTSSKGPFDDQVRSFPGLVDRLRGATTTGEVRGAGPLRQRVRSRVAGRVLLVGDAAGYVDALTGEGLALALAQARAAVAAVVAGEPARYEHDWRALTRRHRMLTSSLVAATSVPALRTALVPAAARLPRLFDAAVNAVAGSHEPRVKECL